MGPQVLLLVFAAVLCVAQGLKCNYCQSINKEHPNCTEIFEKECPTGYNNCIKIILQGSAYGEVRKCANDNECQTPTIDQVQQTCCRKDNCN